MLFVAAQVTKRQLEIPGAGRKSDPELDELAGPYIEERQQREEHQTRELAHRAALTRRMVEKRLESYVFRDGERSWVISISDDVKLKAKEV